MTLTDHPLINLSERETLLTAWSHSKECICGICAQAKALLPAEEYDPWEENNYALQLEGRAYGPHNPDQMRSKPEINH